MAIQPLQSSCQIQLLDFEKCQQPLSQSFSFYLVLSGALSAKIGEDEILLQSGEPLFLQPYQFYKLTRVNKSCIVLCFVLHPSFFSGFFPELQNTTFLSKAKVSDQKLKSQLCTLLIDLAKIYFYKDTGWELSLAAQICQLFHLLIVSLPRQTAPRKTLNPTVRQNRLYNILLYCQSHYTQKFSVQELAKQQNLSTSYLSHFFKAETGISIQGYICQLRTNHACRLIAQTALSLSDICFASGFSDYCYFNREFHQRFGCTAQQFRQNTQEYNRFLSDYESLSHMEFHAFSDSYALHHIKLFESKLSLSN